MPRVWVSAQGMAWVGTSPYRYLLGLLPWPISARLCLSAPLPCLLYPKPRVHTGVHSALDIKGRANPPKAGPPYS